MRHRKSGKKLGRDLKHRKALFKNLVSSLVIQEEIKTTLSKAKSIVPLLDHLITKAKNQTLQSRRLVAAFLQNKKATKKICDELAPRFKQRPGGFTRITRLGFRQGDSAPIVKIELVEKKTATVKKKKGRTQEKEKKV